MELRNAVVVDGVRSPFSRGGTGKFEATRLDEIAAQVVKTLLQRNPRVKPTMIEDFGMGSAMYSRDLVGLGLVSRLAGLPPEVTNFHTNRQCGSSMETMQRIAMSIMVGSSECGIALGLERMGRSLIPAGMGAGQVFTRVNQPNKRVFEMNQLQRDMAHDHFEYFSVPIPDPILDSPPLQPMPQTAQNVVDMYDITREELDRYAVDCHRKLVEAYQAGNYQDEVIALEVEQPVFDQERKWVEEERGPMIAFDRDECIRPETNMEALAKLKPIKGLVSFCDKELKITAGNSCPTNTGAAALLVMSEHKALELGLEPLARIIGMAVGGVKGQIMGMGPVPASKKALKHAGLTVDQIERVEFNEAFAAQVIPSLQELKIPADIVNVNGGALGIGHPLGATGARLVMTLAKELRRSNKRYGIAMQCIGAGQGIATVLEALS